jgi:glucan biosynthesis protein C
MNRRHDIDALRALAFALVILYHVGMYYVAGWGWHIKSPHAAEWLQWPMRALNLWRMDLVFLISGLAFGFLWRGREAGSLLRQRSLRLLLPLAFGMAVIVPYQAYAQAVANGSVQPGLGAFLARYFTGGPWPKNAFDGSDFGVTWNHLWYLPYLWVYTALLLALGPVLRSSPGQWLRARFTGLKGAALMVVPALPIAFYGLTLWPRFPATHDLIHDAWLHAVYFTLFLYGWWIGADKGFWAEATRLRWHALGAAVALLVLHFVVRSYVTPQAPALRQAARLTADLYMWVTILAILGWAHLKLNRPWPWLNWASESVYPWYVLHQTVIIVLAVWLAPLDLGPWLEPAVMMAGTAGLCWLLTDGLIRRYGWLRPLFGLKPRAPSRYPCEATSAYPSARTGG